MSNRTSAGVFHAGRTLAAIAVTMVSLGLVSAKADGPNNIEKPWDSSVALGLSLTRGNSNSENMNGTVQGDKIWTDDELRLKLQGLYGFSNHEKTAESLEGTAQWNHSFSPRWYSAVIADGLHDGVARLGYRLTVAPNAGYYFIKTDVTKLSGEVGPGFVMEKYDGSGAQEYITLRVAERFERQLSKTAKVWETVEYLPKVYNFENTEFSSDPDLYRERDVRDFQNYLLNAEVGIEAAISKAFSVRVVGDDHYNSRPLAGTKYNDIQLVSALVYKF
jgi:putative salt-induced outer membrane protein YdiY